MLWLDFSDKFAIHARQWWPMVALISCFHWSRLTRLTHVSIRSPVANVSFTYVIRFLIRIRYLPFARTRIFIRAEVTICRSRNKRKCLDKCEPSVSKIVFLLLILSNSNRGKNDSFICSLESIRDRLKCLNSNTFLDDHSPGWNFLVFHCHGRLEEPNWAWLEIFHSYRNVIQSSTMRFAILWLGTGEKRFHPFSSAIAFHTTEQFRTGN